MSWSKNDRGRAAITTATSKRRWCAPRWELIAKKGPAGFTFAEAARWAGVSPAAPYRHFRDRDELFGQHRRYAASKQLRGGAGAGLE